jgi:hypothetical protein
MNASSSARASKENIQRRRKTMSKCRSCGAEILWITTFSGKKMPVDAEKIHFYAGEGNELFVTDGGAVVHGTRAEEGQEHTHIGYISHFATCPNADKHRRR